MDNTKNFNLKKPSAEDWYNIQDHNDNMDIVDAELKKLNDGKAPSGHGLGDISPSSIISNFKATLQRGGGFYAVGDADDTPLGGGDWMSLLQAVRTTTEGSETGSQLAFFEFKPNQPQMWLRTVLSGEPGKWVELLHTGNIGKYADAKFACGTYSGVLKEGNADFGNPYCKSKTLPLPFKADYIMVIGATKTEAEGVVYPLYNYQLTIAKGVPQGVVRNPNYSTLRPVNYKWSGNTITWGTELATEIGTLESMNYSGCTYAWFAWGKGEGV